MECTYHEKVDWCLPLRANSPEFVPERGKRGCSKFDCSLIIQSGNDHNVVLHRRCEAWACESSTPHSLQKHWVQVDRIIIISDTINKDLQHSLGSLVKEVAVFNRNVVYHVPGILLTVSRSDGSFLKANQP